MPGLLLLLVLYVVVVAFVVLAGRQWIITQPIHPRHPNERMNAYQGFHTAVALIAVTALAYFAGTALVK